MYFWLENYKNKKVKGLFYTRLSSYVQNVGFFFSSMGGMWETSEAELVS